MTKTKKDDAMICNLCLTTIMDNEPYAQLQEFKKKGQIFKITFYHVACFREQILGKKKERVLLDKATVFLDNVASKLN